MDHHHHHHGEDHHHDEPMTQEEAVKATSFNQCASLGIPDRGELAQGKIADIALLDADLAPRATIVDGRIAWRA